jgi:SEC-C motif-containing protein
VATANFNQHIILVLWFALGIGLQVLLLMRGDRRWGRLTFCAAIGLIAMASGRGESDNGMFTHILFGLGVFAFMFAAMFKDTVLPVISEKVLLSYSMVFWFALYHYHQTPDHNIILLGFLVLPSAATLFVAFKRPQLDFAWKLILYAWFLCIVVTLGLLQFPFRNLSIFLEPQTIPWLAPVDCIVAGMAFSYLAVNIAYLFLLIPIPGRGQSWQSRIKDWHELTDLMTKRFEDEPIHRMGLLLLAGEAVALLVIYFLHWVPVSLTINLFIVLPSLLARGSNSASLALQRQRTVMEAVAEAHVHGVKLGRNDPCPCGSGKKFKFCHGAAGAAAEHESL